MISTATGLGNTRSSTGSAAVTASAKASASVAPTPTATPTATPTPSPSPSPTPYVSPTPTSEPAPIPLDGTIASGDLDLANAAAHITGTLPGLPNFAGEILVVGANAYMRAPGQPKYTTDAAGKYTFTIPPGAQTGNNPISCTYNGVTTPAGDVIAVS